MSNRFKIALDIQKGACNPRPIIAELAKAVSDCYTESVSPDRDSAVFLILDQLSFVLTQYTNADHERWIKARSECELRAES